MRAEAKRTIAAFFREAVEAVPEKTWLLTDDERYTYAAALGQIERAASAIRSAGVRAGDRVLVTARNSPEYLFVWFALMEVGAVQVPVNPKSTAPELAGFIRQVEPVLVVTDMELDPVVVRVADSAARADVATLFSAAPDGRGPAEVDPSDVAVMIPTSGTTGRSKLVMQTHLAYVLAGEGFPSWMQLDADDRLLTSLPLFHINAPAYSTLGSVAARASLVLLPAFSPGRFVDAARRHGATEFNAIGAMLEMLMREPPRADDADNPLRRCYTGPSPDEPRQVEIERRFGFEIVCGYALSETPYGLIWPPGARPFGTLGAARQHPVLGHINDARLVDDAGDAGAGAVGELELRNPAVMRGYYEMPDETAAVLVDGWLRTGDLVRANGDGTFTFVGRRKEVIRRRGENLSPAEVEAVLERHATVAEAAVVGVPDALSEEEVKAFVTAAPGRTIDVEDLHRHARGHLTRFKVPRYLEVVAELPHTPTGRIAKHQLPLTRTEAEVDMGERAIPSPKPGPAVAAADWVHTWIGGSTPDAISLAGRDLPSEVMGHLTFTELIYLLLTKRVPTAGQRSVLDAVLVALADHGLTPSALATRLTYTGAPESIQGAVAAGLLGAGSVFLGPAGDTALFLAAALGEPAGRTNDDATLRPIAREAVQARRGMGARVPGLGHPVHKAQDPRTPRLYELATEAGVLGPHMRLLEIVAEVHAETIGRSLPINGAGAAGAALVDAGVPAEGVRGFVLIARTAGLVAHLLEESETPLGMRLWRELEERAT